MKISKIFTWGVAFAMTTSFLHASEYVFKMQSSDSSGVANFKIQQEWAKKVEILSNGRLKIKMLPVGSVVKHTETLSAIKMGILDGQVTATEYFSGKDPAFGLIGNMIGAWSDTTQLLQYMNFGGGNELMSELYKPYGIQFVGASTTGVESFVSKVPLDKVSDLKGLKLRAPEGLAQQVFKAAGASPVNLPGSEVYTSLSKGVIDAADYTVFSTNQAQGLNKIAPHPVQPGFHSLPLIDISVSLKKWNKLPKDLQQIFKTSVVEFSYDITNKLKLADQKALKEAQADKSITIHNWSDKERKKFRQIAKEQWKEFAKKSKNAQKVYDSVTTFLSNNGLI